ncbi:hypothetical protein AYI68_g7635 [Smittium mucronatum]|uniref:Uncharacterized protein n=1 Tax=Smittium mucronatum TaxID=133383 RepID=A0A1R0GN62_9FUNG|nr:hypothetical protein AYI68_g7635 [Smittium mucronatum]
MELYKVLFLDFAAWLVQLFYVLSMPKITDPDLASIISMIQQHISVPPSTTQPTAIPQLPRSLSLPVTRGSTTISQTNQPDTAGNDLVSEPQPGLANRLFSRFNFPFSRSNTTISSPAEPRSNNTSSYPRINENRVDSSSSSLSSLNLRNTRSSRNTNRNTNSRRSNEYSRYSVESDHSFPLSTFNQISPPQEPTHSQNRPANADPVPITVENYAPTTTTANADSSVVNEISWSQILGRF